jgi:hypothetical protein
VQLGQVQAGRMMKFTSVKDVAAKAATTKAYVREAIAVEKAGLRMERRKTSHSGSHEVRARDSSRLSCDLLSLASSASAWGPSFTGPGSEALATASALIGSKRASSLS